MTIVHAYLGEAVHHLKNGHVRRWRPGEKAPMAYYDAHGKVRARAKEDVERLGSGGYTARIFIGLNVGPRTAWTTEQVVQDVAKIRKGQRRDASATYIAQLGTYEDRQGRLIEEPSVQVIIIDFEGLSKEAFTKDMAQLCEQLRRDFQQETIILEIQKRGIVEDVYSIT